MLWHLSKLGEEALTILAILLGKPDFDTWIRALMNVSPSVHVTSTSTRTLDCYFYDIIIILEYRQEHGVVFRVGDGTEELFGK